MEGGQEPPLQDLSLVLGGPLYRMLVRSRIIRPPLGLMYRWMAVVVVITWAPLAILAGLEQAFATWPGVSFVADLDVHAKLLISVPMLIAAELIVHRRVRVALAQFVPNGLVAPADGERYYGIIRSAWGLRNSVAAEVVLLVLAFTLGHWLWREQSSLQTSTWFAAQVNGTVRYTWAGYWYAFVSLPVARFILFRWYFRLLVWYTLMWRVSRLPLRFNPMHPDRAGGLGFLAQTVTGFAPVLVAQTVLLSAVIGNQIWHEGASLPQFKVTAVAFLAVMILLVLIPPLFFVGALTEARRNAMREYGLLASRYVDEFRRRWVTRQEPPGEEVLGSGDIQSLADLANAYEVVRQTRLIPLDPRVLLRLAVALAVPLLPLTLTMIPLEEVLGRMVKILL